MGKISTPRPVLAIAAVFSRHIDAIEWAAQRLEDSWGPLLQKSDRTILPDTRHYLPSMGQGLTKQLFAFEKLMPPEQLVKRKQQSNAMEQEYIVNQLHNEARPINIDPGYLAPLKLVLASTKDAAHRQYIGEGIFAETTLHYADGGWQDYAWTYPDYRTSLYKQFFEQCRKQLLAMYRRQAPLVQ